MRHLRSARAVQAAAGDDHGSRREFAGRRDEAVDAGFPVARERYYRRVGRHRKAVAPRIVLQESDEFIARVKSLRVRSFVTVTRHHRIKLRRVQIKGVPALGEPGLADPPALQHALRKASFGQHIANTEPCPPSPDHRRVEWPIHAGRSDLPSRLLQPPIHAIALNEASTPPRKTLCKSPFAVQSCWGFGQRCPLWVISGHLQCKTACPLSGQ